MALQMVRCEVWAWEGSWRATPIHSHCCEPSLQLWCFLPGFCVKLPLPTSCSLNQRLGGLCSQWVEKTAFWVLHPYRCEERQNPLDQATHLHPQKQPKKEPQALFLPERTVFKQGALASGHGARATAAAAAIVVILGVAREALASS